MKTNEKNRARGKKLSNRGMTEVCGRDKYYETAKKISMRIIIVDL